MTQAQTSLRECPFCGSGATSYFDEMNWYALCEPCAIFAPGSHETREAATAAWNRRAALDVSSAPGEGWVLVPRQFVVAAKGIIEYENEPRFIHGEIDVLRKAYAAMIAATEGP